MKSFALLATGLLATLAAAAPASNAERQFKATITFEGAGGASYSLLVATDGTEFTIGKSLVIFDERDNPLSVSFISSLGGATCGFTGIDGSKTVIVGAGGASVGPPQAQVSGSCLAL